METILLSISATISIIVIVAILLKRKYHIDEHKKLIKNLKELERKNFEADMEAQDYDVFKKYKI
tara:strand:- start:713 stop:904 length:192 start_codon:yes stop_codon:yes gene_type:complete